VPDHGHVLGTACRRVSIRPCSPSVVVSMSSPPDGSAKKASTSLTYWRPIRLDVGQARGGQADTQAYKRGAQAAALPPLWHPCSPLLPLAQVAA
jgi:hypothetical protein